MSTRDRRQVGPKNHRVCCFFSCVRSRLAKLVAAHAAPSTQRLLRNKLQVGEAAKANSLMNLHVCYSPEKLDVCSGFQWGWDRARGGDHSEMGSLYQGKCRRLCTRSSSAYRAIRRAIASERLTG